MRERNCTLTRSAIGSSARPRCTAARTVSGAWRWHLRRVQTPASCTSSHVFNDLIRCTMCNEIGAACLLRIDMYSMVHHNSSILVPAAEAWSQNDIGRVQGYCRKRNIVACFKHVRGLSGSPRLHLSWILRIVRHDFDATALTGAVHNGA